VGRIRSRRICPKKITGVELNMKRKKKKKKRLKTSKQVKRKKEKKKALIITAELPTQFQLQSPCTTLILATGILPPLYKSGVHNNRSGT
jgi:hypothetical protein